MFVDFNGIRKLCANYMIVTTTHFVTEYTIFLRFFVAAAWCSYVNRKHGFSNRITYLVFPIHAAAHHNIEMLKRENKNTEYMRYKANMRYKVSN